MVFLIDDLIIWGIIAAIAAGVAAGMSDDKSSKPEVRREQYSRQVELTHYLDGTVRRKEG